MAHELVHSLNTFLESGPKPRKNTVFPDRQEFGSYTKNRWARRSRFPHTVHIPLGDLRSEVETVGDVFERELASAARAEPHLVTPAGVSISCGVEYEERRVGGDDAKRKLRMLFQRITERGPVASNVIPTRPPPDNNQTPEPASSGGSEPAKPMPKYIQNIKTWFAAKYAGINWKAWVIDPHGKFYFMWLLLISMTYIYNLIVIPLRSSFPFEDQEIISTWKYMDLICDIIYAFDLIFIKTSISYLDDGVWVKDSKKTFKYYLKLHQFKFDLLAMLPVGYFHSFVAYRVIRLLKWQTFYTFYNKLDKILSAPLISRVARTLIYTFYMIHLNACAYYKMSDYEGIGSNGWVYNGEGNAYVRCFYFATKTSTSIGKLPKPENKVEYLYMTFAWLMGVCVFALLVGQIRYFIMTATKAEIEYRKLLAETRKCMRQLNIPCDLQKKVTSWFEFTWKTQRTLDDNKALSALPINLKTEVAITMHINTLSKVRLFTDCEEALLRDLVLKLRSVIYLPGDVICRKGDIGREMYILKRGEVDVIGGLNNNEVIATLTEGSVFGEISLLNMSGGNRRTADVRSRLFCNIFVLSKNDFNSVMENYPEAYELLAKKAKELIDINTARERAEQENDQTDETTIEIEEEEPNGNNFHVNQHTLRVDENNFQVNKVFPEPKSTINKVNDNSRTNENSHSDECTSQESAKSQIDDRTRHAKVETVKPSKSTVQQKPIDRPPEIEDDDDDDLLESDKCYCKEIRRKPAKKVIVRRKAFNLYRTPKFDRRTSG